MSLIRCSYCGCRDCGDIAHVYWFAPVREADVLRVRQRLCPECVQANIESLLSPPDAESLTCPACGISTEDDVYPVYVTYYPSKSGAVRGAMALCEVHQLEVRLRASKDALDLPDRFVETPDQVVSEPATTSGVFRALGRRDPGVKH